MTAVDQHVPFPAWPDELAVATCRASFSAVYFLMDRCFCDAADHLRLSLVSIVSGRPRGRANELQFTCPCLRLYLAP